MLSRTDFKQNKFNFVRERTELTEEKRQIGMRTNILQLVTKQGLLNIVNENGQRKLGPSQKSKGPPPPPECEVFVGKLPRDIYEDEIYPVFSKIGEIYQMHILTNFSGLNRGFGFIMYSNVECANRAVAELNNYEIRPGQRIGVLNSINNSRISISKLPLNINIEYFIKRIYELTADVIKVAVYRHLNKHIIKAIISYSTHIAAARARKKLIKESGIIFQGVKLTVEWAYPNEHFDDAYEESGIMNENGNMEFKRILLSSQKCSERNPSAHSAKNDSDNNLLKTHDFKGSNNLTISNNKNELVDSDSQLLKQIIQMLFNMLPDPLISLVPSIEIWDFYNYHNENTNSNENLRMYRMTSELYRIFLESKNSFSMMNNIHRPFS